MSASASMARQLVEKMEKFDVRGAEVVKVYEAERTIAAILDAGVDVADDVERGLRRSLATWRLIAVASVLVMLAMLAMTLWGR